MATRRIPVHHAQEVLAREVADNEKRPHMHPSFNPKAHMPGPRIAIEDVIEGCIQIGARRSCGDWKERLLETGTTHKLYRTWVDSPPVVKAPAKPGD